MHPILGHNIKLLRFYFFQGQNSINICQYIRNAKRGNTYEAMGVHCHINPADMLRLQHKVRWNVHVNWVKHGGYPRAFVNLAHGFDIQLNLAISERLIPDLLLLRTASDDILLSYPNLLLIPDCRRTGLEWRFIDYKK